MKCPACAALLDGVQNADGGTGTPRCGDLTVCRYCAALLQFIFGAGGLAVKRLKVKDLVEIGKESDSALSQLLVARAQVQYEIGARKKAVKSTWN